MVCLGQNGHFRRNALKYAAVWQCPAPPDQICARRHPAVAICSSPAPFQRLSRQIGAHAEAWVKSGICWCASVETAVSEGMGANVEQYGSVLRLRTRFAPSGTQQSQYAAAPHHSSAYLARFAPMRRHGLSRAFAGVPRSKRPFLRQCVK